tara:strand:+ start:513 stop:959 length:447 start_codon:yes stop_codon:yes gene_type:complete
MRNSSLVLCGVLVCIIVVASGCLEATDETTCDKLTSELDSEPNLVDLCDRWVQDKSIESWAGGTLTNVSEPEYDSWYERGWDYRLTIEGNEREVVLHKTDDDGILPSYEIGKFYKFDQTGYCATLYSMASSGNFGGELILVEECSVSA